MFSFHTRARSLIPVSAITDYHLKSEAYIEEVEDVEEDVEEQGRQHTCQYILIGLLFLADAMMQSSLSSSVDALLPTNSSCVTMESSFLRSIMQCAYYLGASTGLVWGMAADSMGRRRVALISLWGSLICCFSMAFATTFAAFAGLRYVAGVFGSAGPIAALALLADLTHASKQRTWLVARLPLVVVVGGQVGPLLSAAITHFAQRHFHAVLTDYPALGGQTACGLVVLLITIAEGLLLRETLPTLKSTREEEDSIDCEKAAFLGQSHSNNSQDSLAISIVDALHDDAPSTSPLPSHITISQLLTAPSVLILLASFSALSLHSSTFDLLLPHLGQHATQDIGLGLPCALLQPVMLVVKVVAAASMLCIPALVDKIGLMRLYRTISLTFPALYILLPIIALATAGCGESDVLAGAFSTLATLLKTTLTSAAQVLVLLLALSMAPDASSTGTLIGVISIAEMFKALAVGIAGVSYFLSDDYSMWMVNGALWTALAVIASLGALITRRLRETTRVGTDLPEECLVWQGMFDVDSEDEAGF
ncbi:uncharacterized protein RCC_02887 [Ramularia collo-cygni]|uniref:Major facilitator superfamily (MFS) profile domain-containing protein n=1 Tax=Ramularia collo-cygni TaxID=112498 RepID=A0A2D3UT57_9PEZI|nr:uncharacterized protein RCC_02887 [Ramularia collo-cygni]CZT17055.1 uncharacterized protein RCC_02887 [Ramularia collo-cygni]